MAETKEDKKDPKAKDAKGKDAGKADVAALGAEPQPMSEALIAELEELTSTQRAATLMLQKNMAKKAFFTLRPNSTTHASMPPASWR